jgi:competence protein ComGF
MDAYLAAEVAYQNGRAAGIQELTNKIKALKCLKDSNIVCLSVTDLENLADNLINKKEAK